jgi:hypothetical protein
VPDPPLEHFEDDESLDGDEGLFRRLRPDWVVWDENDPSKISRVSSVAFQLQSPEVAERLGYPGRCMSIALERTVMENPRGVDALVGGPLANYGIARVTAGQMREQQFGLQIVPEVDEPWHVVAFPLDSISRAKTAQTPLAEKCKIVRVPQRGAIL